MRTIYVPLPEIAAERLRALAEREYREPRDQATVLILEGLRRAGVLDNASGGRRAQRVPAEAPR